MGRGDRPLVGIPRRDCRGDPHHHTGDHHGLAWVVTRARELEASLGIGDGLVGAEPPDPGSEAAMLPVAEELGGEAAVIERIKWYCGAFRAA